MCSDKFLIYIASVSCCYICIMTIEILIIFKFKMLRQNSLLNIVTCCSSNACAYLWEIKDNYKRTMATGTYQ